MFSPSSLALDQRIAVGGFPVSERGFRRSRHTAAFTLLEIMVVLAIIGLLVGVAMSNLNGIFGKSQAQVAKLFVTSEVEIPLTSYRVDMGNFPTAEDGGLNALWVAPASKADRWHGPYAKGNAAPPDPWGNPYHYLYPGTHNKGSYDIWSTGPDGVDGSSDNVGNW
jgi:general secretion pathway protein G